MEQRTNQTSLSSTVKKTRGGKDAQRSHQQLHRAAQIHAGEGIHPAGSKHQAGESRHPGDDGVLPETAAAAQDFSSTESPFGRLFPVLEGDHELPICQLQGGRCTSASEPLPRSPEISYVSSFPSAHQGEAGTMCSQSSLETLVETQT